LLELLEQKKGQTISGEAIARELQCTRAAVWKAVKSLREAGYDIQAGPNKGYMLSVNSNHLSAEGLRLFLQHPDVYLQVYKETGSTNQNAKEAAVGGLAGHGSFVIAEGQTAGRGRRGRTFFSPEGSGMYLSVILQPEGTLQESLLLTTAAATAVYKAVLRVCGISLDIKWVNDLYYRGRKVCGILTEAITDFESGEIQYAVVGIGLNLCKQDGGFPEELQEIAGVLYEDTASAASLNRNQLAAEIVNCLLEEAKNRTLSPEYIEHNIVPGKQIRITNGQQSRQALALSICPDGRLEVREEDGSISRLTFGEVSVCLDFGA
jgi:BirA family biotin operon repressor/biotin-[acetyl-CoA-carboxylase] ligase